MLLKYLMNRSDLRYLRHQLNLMNLKSPMSRMKHQKNLKNHYDLKCLRLQMSLMNLMKLKNRFDQINH
jgi:hypothetical protein